MHTPKFAWGEKHSNTHRILQRPHSGLQCVRDMIPAHSRQMKWCQFHRKLSIKCEVAGSGWDVASTPCVHTIMPMCMTKQKWILCHTYAYLTGMLASFARFGHICTHTMCANSSNSFHCHSTINTCVARALRNRPVDKINSWIHKRMNNTAPELRTAGTT